MSTKIYNGYLIDANPSTFQLKEMVHQFRKVLRETRNGIIKELYTKDSYKKVHSELWKRALEIKRSNLSDPVVDFSAEICFIPIENKMLAITYWEHREYTKAWQSLTNVKYYGYWNNTDQDEDCSDEEWKQREEDWGKALPGIGVPALVGFNIVVLDYSLPYANEIWTE